MGPPLKGASSTIKMVHKSGWKLVGLGGDDGGSLFKDSAFDQLRRFLRSVYIHDAAFGGKEQAAHELLGGCPCEPRDDGEDDACERYAAWPCADPRPRPSSAGWPRGAERPRVAEGGGDGVERVIAQPRARPGASDARPALGPRQGMESRRTSELMLPLTRRM
jgi:hypothetical protein